MSVQIDSKFLIKAEYKPLQKFKTCFGCAKSNSYTNKCVICSEYYCEDHYKSMILDLSKFPKYSLVNPYSVIVCKYYCNHFNNEDVIKYINF